MLSQRQLDVLRLVIQLNSDTGEPVGSKTLMNAGIKASSATIRNDLALLEKTGLIEKPHTSAGRVPSLKGYRFYVDHLLQPSHISHEELSLIKQSFKPEYSALNDIIEKSAHVLSELTSYTAFSLGPEMSDRKLTGFRIVPLNNQQVMAIIITNRGNVESQVFTIPENISSEDLEKIVNIVNDKLVGEPLLVVYNKLRTEIPIILQRYFSTPRGIMRIFDSVLGSTFQDHVYIGGHMNLLDFNLIPDVHQIKSVYSFMNNQEEVSSLIHTPKSEIEIKIGDEINNTLLTNMSLITASYEVSKHGKGTIAILGPTNMSYGRVFTLVDTYRRELANYLTDYYRLLDS